MLGGIKEATRITATGVKAKGPADQFPRRLIEGPSAQNGAHSLMKSPFRGMMAGKPTSAADPGPPWWWKGCRCHLRMNTSVGKCRMCCRPLAWIWDLKSLAKCLIESRSGCMGRRMVIWLGKLGGRRARGDRFPRDVKVEHHHHRADLVLAP